MLGTLEVCPCPSCTVDLTPMLTGHEPLHLPLPPQESAPFAVIGSNTVVEAKGQRVRGRLYPWGIVEGESRPGAQPLGGKAPLGRWPTHRPPLPTVENQAHCDFVKLRNMLIRTHMHDLKDVTCDVHYENYRAHCIQQMTRCPPPPRPSPVPARRCGSRRAVLVARVSPASSSLVPGVHPAAS